MTMDRRRALAALAAGAAAGFSPPAVGAPRLAAADDGTPLNLPKQTSPVYTAAAPRPNGGLLWSWIEEDGFAGGALRAFDDKLDPDGGRKRMFETKAPGWVRGWSIALTPFADETALFLHVSPGEGGSRLLAVPVSKDGSPGRSVEIAAGQIGEVFATRIAGERSIVVWRSVSRTGPEVRDVHWRVVGRDGAPDGAVRTLARPDGVMQQTPLSLTTLAWGGAALGYRRSENFEDDEGRLFVQRIGVGGKPDGAPMAVGARGGYLALAGLKLGGCVAVRPAPGGALKARFTKPGHGLHPEVTIDTGLDRLSASQAGRFGLQATHAWYGGALLLVGGVKGDRSVVSVLLIDEIGRLVRKPTIVASARRTAGDASGLRAMQAVTLANKDVFVAWSDGGEFDPGPTRGMIVRIA